MTVTKTKHRLINPATHIAAVVGFLCLVLMFLFSANAGQNEPSSIYYYLVSATGAPGFSWLLIALCMDVWTRFERRPRSGILLSFLFLSVGALLIYYIYLIRLERRQMPDRLQNL